MKTSGILTPLEVANQMKKAGFVNAVVALINGQIRTNDARADFLKEAVMTSEEWKSHEAVFLHVDFSNECLYLVAIHSTRRGQPIGGVRFFPYRTLDGAIDDVLGLANGMTNKTAMADMWVGGGKAAIIPFTNVVAEGFFTGAAETIEAIGTTRKSILEGYAHFAASLGGLFISGKDANLHTVDMEYMLHFNVHTCCLDENVGGAGSVSEVTSHGVYMGMKAGWNASHEVALEGGGHSILMKGLGEVGMSLSMRLMDEGNRILAYEPRIERVSLLRQKYDTTAFEFIEDYSQFISTSADIFSPNAMSGSLSADVVNKLNVQLIAGAENAQIMKGQEEKIATLLYLRGITYIPEMAINYMGVFMAWLERVGVSSFSIKAKTLAIGERTAQLVAEALKFHKPVFTIAMKYATESLKMEHPMAEIRGRYSGMIMDIMTRLELNEPEIAQNKK